MGGVLIKIFVLILIVTLHVSMALSKRPEHFRDVSQDCIEFASLEKSGRAYQLAQKELSTHIQGHGKKAGHDICENIHGHSWGASLFFINGSAFAYEYIFKGNSENIHRAYADQEDISKTVHSWKEKRQVYMASSPSKLKHKAQAKYNTTDIKVFTFMRDPLSHFISGLVESHFRSFGIKNRNMSDTFLAQTIKSNQVGFKFAHHMLDGILFDTDDNRKFISDHLADCTHFAVQSYSLIEWKPDVIGYLENFQDDWQRVNSFLGLNVTYQDSSPELSHPTVGDPMNLKASLLEVLHHMPKYMRAVCRLLMVDYVCLRYTLPRECADMMTMFKNLYN